MENKDKPVFLITGGSSEIGRAIAVKAAKAGYFVCLTYLSNTKGAALTLEEVRQHDGEGAVFKTDVSNLIGVRSLFNEITKRFGYPSILVNNAGLSGARKSFLEFSEDEISEIIRINLLSTVFCCQEALKLMVKAKKGSIINLSSLVASTGGFEMPVYSASKGAIETLTKSLSNEFGHHGIRVNAIAPGVIKTTKTPDLDSERIARTLLSIPLGRLGTVSEVAEAVVWLASDKSSYINGASLNVTGGKH